MEITKHATLKEIREMPEFAPMHDAFVGAAVDWLSENGEDCTIEGLTQRYPTWYYGDILLGLERLGKVAESGAQYVFDIYSKEEIEQDPALGRVKLVCHPVKEQTSQVYALLLSGGAYGAVCTMVESMPVAARLNDLGISAFSLNYRTASAETAQQGLMPKPLEDVARAIRFLESNFGVDPSQLIVGGFSAGGHLAAMWGTRYASYGFPKPKMLMLDYPLITMENFPEPVQAMYGAGLLGPKWDKTRLLTMSAHRFVSPQFPKTYLVMALDDDTVPTKDSYDLEEALIRENIPHLIERVEHGGHGFGLGSVSDAAGWVDRAIKYMGEEV